jgi:hypothetical protein
MKISKLLPVLCVFAVGASGLVVRAEDNPAQAAARRALARQLFELSAQTATNAAIAPAPTPVPAPASPKPAETRTEAAAPKAQPQAREQSDAQTAALMAALMARMNADSPAKTATNNWAVAQPEAAVKTATKQKPAPATQLPLLLQPYQTSDANYAGKELGLKPIAPPPLPISTSKEEQLQVLLIEYKANQITPEQYQKRRAAILAGPDK